MLKRIVFWIIIFFLGFIGEILGFSEQKVVFFGIYLIIFSIGFVLRFVGYSLCKLTDEKIDLTMKDFLFFVILTSVTLIASKLFKTDFYIVFELLTLGKCLNYDD